MPPVASHLKKFLLIALPVAVAAGVFVHLKGQKQPPERLELAERATAVRVIEAEPMAVVPRALGYGNARPGRRWEGVAEISGRVLWTHPNLKNGAILPAGTELVRIDAADYELTLAEADAQLAEKAVAERNTRASLAIEKRNLELARADLARKRKLSSRGAVSESAVDEAARDVLAIETAIQSLNNTLALLPTERRVLEARRDAARLDLGRARIAAPMDLRVGRVDVEADRYVAKGALMFTADSLDTAEVEAQVPIDRLMPVLAGADFQRFDVATVADNLSAIMNVTLTVRLRQGGLRVEWPARLSRIAERVDPETRTVGVVAIVDGPYENVRPGHRPPLARDMFVELELKGAPRPSLIAVPRSALHSDRLYILTSDNRLERRPVKIAFAQSGFAVLESGLQAGERIIVSDLVPAVDGMLLAPTLDAEAAGRLRESAGGSGAVK